MNPGVATTSPTVVETGQAALLGFPMRTPRWGRSAPGTEPPTIRNTETPQGEPNYPPHPQPLQERPPRRTVPFSPFDDRRIAAARVLGAVKAEEIAPALSFVGWRAVAERVQELCRMVGDDPDEPPIVLASLRELALFLLSQPQIPEPEIGVSPNGLALAEWASAERGVLAMKFLPDGRIQFAAVSAAAGSGPPFRVHGELPRDRTVVAVQGFLPATDSRAGPRRAR